MSYGARKVVTLLVESNVIVTRLKVAPWMCRVAPAAVGETGSWTLVKGAFEKSCFPQCPRLGHAGEVA